MKKTPILMLGLITGTFALQSCVDNSYDLDDIDMTLGTSADLTLPSSSTSDILLKNIMDLEEDGVVQFITDSNGDSIFAFIQSGTADVEDINIEKIEIDKITLSPINADVDLSTLSSDGSGAPRKGLRKVTINVNGTSVLLDKDYYYEIQEDQAKSLFDKSTEDISCDVQRIDNITLKEAVVTLPLTMSVDETWIKRVYLDNFELEIPADLHVASAKLGGIAIPAADITPGKIKLTGTTYPQKFNEELTLELTFDKIQPGNNFTFTPNADPDKLGTANVNGTFKVSGSFRVSTKSTDDIDVALLQAAIDAATPAEKMEILGGDISSILPPSVHFTGNPSFKGNKISVQSFSGRIRHKVTDIEPIKLDDLPPFLNHDDVVLDLSNPVILLKATHALPAVAQTGLTLTSTVKGSTHTVTVPGISVPGYSATKTYYIADKEADKQIFPDGYKSATKQAHTGKVKELIEKIPEEITVGVEPVELEVTDLDITKSYKVDIEYQVFAPMYIGKDMELVYTETERGWAEDLDDLEDVNFDNIVLNAEVDSDLPADLILTLKAIDENAGIINAITVNSDTIPAKASNHPISLKLEPAAGYTINDALAGKNGVNRLDGIQYEAYIKGNAAYDGTALPKNAKIKLKNIKITIKGNVTYDAN